MSGDLLREAAAVLRLGAEVATMHPGVGLAVAGWLEAEADLAADPRNHAEVLKEALAVANAILGRQP